jgi:hypothetical protein
MYALLSAGAMFPSHLLKLDVPVLLRTTQQPQRSMNLKDVVNNLLQDRR